MPRRRRCLGALFALLVAGAPALAGVEPLLAWRPGERYFRVEGAPRLVVGRNPVAVRPIGFADHFANMAAAGETFARIHFCYLPPDEKAGEVHPGMLRNWDAVLDAAEQHRVAVLPVFGIWAYWNDGSQGEVWHNWHNNPYNLTRGGPARSPAELFEPGVCRSLWMKRLAALVNHWSARRCIVAWEVFSELNLVTGADENKARGFVEEAATIIRGADEAHRPITASLAGLDLWPRLFESSAIDLVQVHPYGDTRSHDLDELILRTVRQRLSAYRKPVLLGECGLDWRPPRGTLDVSPRAPVGIRHAIWAAVVSGAMNARMLWWQDGYDQFEQADVGRLYQQVAAPAAQFVKDLDCTELAPLDGEWSAGLRGAILGSAAGPTFVAWCRDARCVAPDWPEAPTSGQRVVIPARDGSWQVDLVSPATGVVAERRQLVATGNRLRVELPEFRGSVALRGRWNRRS